MKLSSTLIIRIPGHFVWPRHVCHQVESMYSENLSILIERNINILLDIVINTHNKYPFSTFLSDPRAQVSLLNCCHILCGLVYCCYLFLSILKHCRTALGHNSGSVVEARPPNKTACNLLTTHY